MRLDQYLVEHGYARGRDSAKRAIKAGRVRLNGELATKAATTVSGTAVIEFEGDEDKFVSRGALKLIKGLEAFDIDPADKICIDLGASTGGFSEVLLSRKAKKIFAIDVGTDQLHERIKSDERVRDISPVHAKDLSEHLIDAAVDILVCDVSFISLKKALPVPISFCRSGAELCILIKPQFELGQKYLGKGGIVSLDEVELDQWVQCHMVPWFTENEIEVLGVISSPIEGGDGNKEFLLGGRIQ